MGGVRCDRAAALGAEQADPQRQNHELAEVLNGVTASLEPSPLAPRSLTLMTLPANGLRHRGRNVGWLHQRRHRSRSRGGRCPDATAVAWAGRGRSPDGLPIHDLRRIGHVAGEEVALEALVVLGDRPTQAPSSRRGPTGNDIRGDVDWPCPLPRAADVPLRSRPRRLPSGVWSILVPANVDELINQTTGGQLPWRRASDGRGYIAYTADKHVTISYVNKNDLIDVVTVHHVSVADDPSLVVIRSEDHPELQQTLRKLVAIAQAFARRSGG
jgi:hypothetical protein